MAANPGAAGAAGITESSARSTITGLADRSAGETAASSLFPQHFCSLNSSQIVNEWLVSWLQSPVLLAQAPKELCFEERKLREGSEFLKPQPAADFLVF